MHIYETILFMKQNLVSHKIIFPANQHINKYLMRSSNNAHQLTQPTGLFQNSTYKAGIQFFNVLPFKYRKQIVQHLNYLSNYLLELQYLRIHRHPLKNSNVSRNIDLFI